MTEPKNYYDPNDTRCLVDNYLQNVLVAERNRLAARVESMQKRIDWLTKREKELEARVQELERAERKLIRDSLSLQVKNTRLREALERIEGMAERPVCVCGIQTGTAAIKSCARAALKEKP